MYVLSVRFKHSSLGFKSRLAPPIWIHEQVFAPISPLVSLLRLAINGPCIPLEGARRDLNASELCFSLITGNLSKFHSSKVSSRPWHESALSRGISLKKDNSRKISRKKTIRSHLRLVTSYELGWPCMTDTWQVIYCVFIGADIDFDIRFALNDDPEAQDRCKFRIVYGWNEPRNRPLACMTLSDLVLMATVYGSYIQ